MGLISGDHTFLPIRRWLVTLPPRWAMPRVSVFLTSRPIARATIPEDIAGQNYALAADADHQYILFIAVQSCHFTSSLEMGLMAFFGQIC